MIPSELRSLVDVGCAVVIGSGDADGAPDAVRGHACSFEPSSGTGEVLRVGLVAGVSDRLIANARATKHVTVCITRMTDYTSYQVKGRALEVIPPTDADRAWGRRWVRMYIQAARRVGCGAPAEQFTPEIRHVLRLAVSEVFLQTPGPRAGTKVSGASSSTRRCRRRSRPSTSAACRTSSTCRR